METLVKNPSVYPAVESSDSATSAGTHWLWWLFLVGILACSCAGPTCALG